jgi:hypothetical protein
MGELGGMDKLLVPSPPGRRRLGTEIREAAPSANPQLPLGTVLGSWIKASTTFHTRPCVVYTATPLLARSEQGRFAVFKEAALGPSERFGLESRSEFFNLPNRTPFGPPSRTLGTPQFGGVSSQINNARLMQLG